MSCSSQNLGHNLRGLSKPNSLSQLAESHLLHCLLHRIKDGYVSQVGVWDF